MLLDTPVLWPSMPVNRGHNLAKGLVAWWLVIPQFTGGVKWIDLAGANHGTLTTMALTPTATSGLARGTSRQGGFGEVRFDGSSDYVTVTRTPILDLGTAITLCAWIRPTLSGSFPMILSKYISNADRYEFLLNSGNGYKPNFTVRSGATTDATTVPTASIWQHLAATYDGTTVRYYYNGKPDGSKAEAIESTGGDTANIAIGDRTGAGGIRLTGMLDDVRIYNRALSAQEVFNVYHNSRQGYPGLLNKLSLFVNPAALTAYIVAASQGSYAYTGQVASLLRKRLVSNVQGSYVYTGQTAQLLRKRLVSNNQGVYTYTGQVASLLNKHIIGNVQGSYAYTGQVALLERSRFVTVNNGNYVYNGQAAVFVLGKGVTAVQGAYTYNGQSINTLWKQVIPLVQGAYTYSGQTAQLLHKQLVVLVQGAYTYTGEPVIFRLGKSLLSGSGSYAYSGQSINTLWKQVITIVGGSYTYNGQPVTFAIHTPFVILPIGVGVYTYTGQAVNLLNKQLVLTNSGSYVYSGQAVSLRESGIVSSQAQGSYVYTGQPVILLNKQLLSLNSGSYAYNGQVVALLNKHISGHAQGGYVYTGQGVNLYRGKAVGGIQGTYTYTGQAVQFPYSQRLSAVFGMYAYTGQTVSLLAIVQEALFIIEMNIIPTVNGIVKIQAFPIGPASNVIVKRGSTGFMFDV